MIKNLQIKNFKGLSELNINDFSRVNLIGGRNNTGKTSLLEALFLLHDRANPHMILRIHGWRGIQFVDITPEAMWAPMFSIYDMKKDIEISVDTDNKENRKLILRFNNKYVKNEIAGYHPVLNGGTKQIRTDLSSSPTVALDLIFSSSKIKQKQYAHLLIESGSIGMHLDFKEFEPILAIFMAANARITPFEDAVRYGKVEIIGEQNEIIEIIKKTIEPRLINLTSIALSNQSAILHAQLEGINRKIPVAYMGDGMNRILSIILAISTTQNGCVFIDEVENGIHYSVLPKIWTTIVTAAKKFNCQIFATTHSYECLEAAVKSLDPDLQDEFRYIRLEKNGDKLFSNTYSFPELATSIENQWEIR